MSSDKYQNSKIYKITDHGYTECYIGSTFDALSNRFAKHRQGYNGYKNGKKKYCTAYSLFEKYGIDGLKIELMEEFPCQNREQLRKQEGFHIQNNTCVNKLVAGRSLQESSKAYYEKNKETTIEKMHRYSQNHKEKIAEQKKQYYAEHKEEKDKRDAERRRQRTTCSFCGIELSKGCKSGHIKRFHKPLKDDDV